MNYRKLVKFLGGAKQVAYALETSPQVVHLWSSRGLPKSYARRVALNELVLNSPGDEDERQALSEYVLDPKN